MVEVLEVKEEIKNEPDIDIFVCLLCYDGKICADTFVALHNNLITLVANKINYVVSVQSSESLVVRGRNTMASQFLATNAKYLMFVDVDLSFPNDTIGKLYLTAEREGHKVLCGAYPKKRYKHREIAKELLNGLSEEDAICKTSDYIFNSYTNGKQIVNSCMEMEEIGTGLMMIHRSTFETMIEKGKAIPYNNYADDNSKHQKYDFFNCIIDERGYFLSEDYAFCKKVRDCGIKTYILVDIPINHQGVHTWHGNFLTKLGIKKNVEDVTAPKKQEQTLDTDEQVPVKN